MPVLSEEQKAQKQKDARDRWLRLAPARTNRALRSLRTLRHCASSNGYKFTDEERDQVTAAISDECQRLVAAFEEQRDQDKFQFRVSL